MGKKKKNTREISKVKEQTALEFYTSLETQFPSIRELELLNGIDLKMEGFMNAGIMTKLAKELNQFYLDQQFDQAIDFMKLVEEAFEKADKIVTSYLTTDFIVTIMEQNKNSREYLKSIMGDKTKGQ